MARHRGALRPAFPIAQADDPDAGRRAASVRGLFQYDAGDVLARPPAFRPNLEQPELAAVQRERMHRDQGFVRFRLRLRHLADRNRLRA
jgi:hypothetical protein